MSGESASVAEVGATGSLDALLDQVDGLLASLSEAEASWAGWLSAVAPENRPSARNPAHYWAFRQFDLRELQTGLAALGLSSLGRCESHVQATLAAVRAAIVAVAGGTWRPPPPSAVPIGKGPEILRQRAVELLGPRPAHRSTRIMVTLPSEAATDPGLVRELVRRGMNLARINCAHDDVAAWRAMAGHVRAAARSVGHHVPGGNGPGGAEAADRSSRAGTPRHQTATATRRARSGHRSGAGVAGVAGATERPTRSRYGLAHGAGGLARPTSRRRGARRARHAWLQAPTRARRRRSGAGLARVRAERTQNDVPGQRNGAARDRPRGDGRDR